MLGITPCLQVTNTGDAIAWYTRVVGALALLCAFAVGPAAAQGAQAAPASESANPLDPFEQLIGGKWHLGDSSYQEFEWGVGRRSVKARSYFVVDGEAQLVSEGIWYWHPGEQTIKGTFTAKDMPFWLFDYTTRFEEDSMLSELAAYTGDGKLLAYTERIEFLDANRYEWTLFAVTPEGPEREMGGTYARAE